MEHIENRLEGCPNPYYRGRLHGVIACIIPR